jgi:hypothetical protein
MDVDVLDIIAIVAYMLQDDPQPFLFDAADINEDEVIDVLDIIAVVNIMMGVDRSGSGEDATSAVFSLDDGQLWITSDGEIGGYQFIFHGSVDDLSISTLYPMELVTRQFSEDELFVLVYSMNLESIPGGSHPVLTLSHTEGLELTDLVVSDTQGRGVGTTLGVDGLRALPETFSLGQNYPNPFNGTTTMEYSIPVTTDLTLTVYNLLGQEVYTYNRENIEPGWYRFTWRGTDLSGREVSSGVYIYQLNATGFISNKKMLFIK